MAYFESLLESVISEARRVDKEERKKWAQGTQSKETKEYLAKSSGNKTKLGAKVKGTLAGLGADQEHIYDKDDNYDEITDGGWNNLRGRGLAKAMATADPKQKEYLKAYIAQRHHGHTYKK